MNERLITACVVSVAVLPAAAADGDEKSMLFVNVEQQYPSLLALGATVLNTFVPPRFESSTAMSVETADSDDTQLQLYFRSDVRKGYTDRGMVQRADGRRSRISAEISPGLRWVRVRDRDGALVMEFDAGPSLVAACGDGTLTPELCATFDSDGDGCKDDVDDDPLVPETTPPVITGSVSPNVLWPPNHKLKTVTASVTASDNCTASPEIVLESVTSSDPEDGITDGDAGPDMTDFDLGTFDATVRLRAERWPGQTGARTYTLVYLATDRAGNQARLSLTVDVPVSAGGGP